MRFEDLNWFDIEKYLQKDDRLILILGACEQHGYLSLLSDVRIPTSLADAASKETGVLIAPPLNFGVSPYFLDYPGTLSLSTITLIHAAQDLVRSAYRQGFKRFLVLNGHSGNDPARYGMYELANELTDAHFAWYAWWQSHSIEDVAIKHQLKPYHAAWSEAFSFNIVTEVPQGEKLPAHVPGLLSAEDARRAYGDGVFGGMYTAPPEVMDELFEAALLDIIQLLKFQ